MALSRKGEKDFDADVCVDWIEWESKDTRRPHRIIKQNARGWRRRHDGKSKRQIKQEKSFFLNTIQPPPPAYPFLLFLESESNRRTIIAIQYTVLILFPLRFIWLHSILIIIVHHAQFTYPNILHYGSQAHWTESYIAPWCNTQSLDSTRKNNNKSFSFLPSCYFSWVSVCIASHMLLSCCLLSSICMHATLYFPFC